MFGVAKEDRRHVLRERIGNLIPVCSTIHRGQEDTLLLAIVVLLSASPGPSMTGVDEVNLIYLLRNIHLRVAPVAG